MRTMRTMRGLRVSSKRTMAWTETRRIGKPMDCPLSTGAEQKVMVMVMTKVMMIPNSEELPAVSPRIFAPHLT